jgi:hypothetical protein
VAARLKGKQIAPSFIALAVRRFEAVRNVPNLVKPPATGELVMWSTVLVELGIDEATLKNVETLGQLPAIQPCSSVRTTWT